MDSGVGGLAVLQAFARHLPDSGYLFVGDTAWMPYGEKPLPVVRERVLTLHAWLEAHYDLAAFVLACNTGTVAAMDTLSRLDRTYPILEPVYTTAEWINQNIPRNQRLGILATPGTVSSGRYPKLLHPEFQSLSIPCSGLASLIESGQCQGPDLEMMLRPYVQSLLDFKADVTVLACTHYSFIRPVLEMILPRGMPIIDSSDILARAALPVIEHLPETDKQQQIRVTGDPIGFRQALDRLPLPEFKKTPILPLSLVQTEPLIEAGHPIQAVK